MAGLAGVTAVHPSHMPVLVTLPLRHQEALRGRLARLQQRLTPFEWMKEYLRVQLLCFPEHTGGYPEREAVILQRFDNNPEAARQALAELRADTVAAADAGADAAADSAGEPPGPRPVRTTGACMLPYELHDVWPRVFRALTSETARLERELAEAEEQVAAFTRPARVESMNTLVIDYADENILGSRELLAVGLQGWPDLYAFMCAWLAEVDLAPVNPASDFRSVAEAMGLHGELPPLLKCEWMDSTFSDLAAAGYMVA